MPTGQPVSGSSLIKTLPCYSIVASPQVKLTSTNGLSFLSQTGLELAVLPSPLWSTLSYCPSFDSGHCLRFLEPSNLTLTPDNHSSKAHVLKKLAQLMPLLGDDGILRR